MRLKLEKPRGIRFDPKLVCANFDAKAVARLVRNHDNAMKSGTAEALDAAQREVDLMDRWRAPGLIAYDKARATTLTQQVRQEAETLASEERPTAAIAAGHNPNLFPPFFNGGRSGVVGGVTATPIFRLRPDAGSIAISVAAYLPGGHVDRTAAMGALTIAPSTEVVTASASTFVGGTLFALSALGYGRASARLTVSLAAEGSAGFRSATGALLLGDLAFGLTRIPLTNMTASARLMVNAGDLLLVTCGLRVTAGCGGIVCAAVSNFAISGTVLCLV